MQVRWHRLALDCPDCETPAQIMGVSFARDGEILVEMICVKCSHRLTWKASITGMIAGAAIADWEEEHPKAHTVIQMPLLSPDDTTFLRDMHIDPNEEAA